ncbi:hypothetical protein [Vreelandella utahensis]|uniref:hypothetical protein n=1 Tax=Vreelandella halophila TaxID=86177 RepID=UPI0009846D4E|nr:hypothetical protein [Halomonas utahensis]
MTVTGSCRRALILVLIIVLLSGCSTGEEESAASLTEQAQQILVDRSEDGGLDKALELTQRATEVDPGYVPAYTARINILKRMGKAEGIVKATERLAELQPNHENRLYLCMAQEATGKSDGKNSECYQQVVKEIEDESNTSAGKETYLLALRLAEDDAFEDELDAYLKSLESDVARDMAQFKFVESTRSDLFQVAAPVSEKPKK